MNRDEKAALVDEIAGQLQEAEAVFAVDYRGLSVSAAADLRDKLRGADTRFRIVKNSLSERAADKAGVEALKPLLEGPTALALVHGDAALAAKALNDTARALNILEFKGGLMNGNALTGEDIRSIARLPAREVLYSQLVGTVAAPITGLARGLNALIAGLAIQLKAIADQGLVSGEAPAPEADAAPEPQAAIASEPEAANASEREAANASETEPEAANASEREAAAELEDGEAREEREAASEAPPQDGAPESGASGPEGATKTAADPEAAPEPADDAEPAADAADAAESAPDPEQTEQPEPEAEAASDAEPSDE